jgi:methyl-accepting chemotaxis protein
VTKSSGDAISRLMDAIAASREATDRQLSVLAAKVEQTTQNVDRMGQNIDRMGQNIDRMEQNVDRAMLGMQQTADRIERHVNDAVVGMQQSADRIELQVGLMSEHLTAIDIKIERLADRISELTNAVNGHLEVAKQQALNIGELTKLVAAQTNMVATFMSRSS